MIEYFDIPDSIVERAAMMERLMAARATGDLGADRELYEVLRREFVADSVLNPLLPEFVRTCRSLDVFWPYIKEKGGKLCGAPPDYQRCIRAPDGLPRTATQRAYGSGRF